jgi:carbamoyltransferase
MARIACRLRDVGIAAPLHRVPHHLAHAASASLVLHGEPGVVLTADGMGEWTTAATWAFDGRTFRRLRRAVYPHSAGKVYAAVTAWLGFRAESDEGKTMGLAAYGDPDAPGATFTRSLLRPDARRILRVDTGSFGYPWGEARLFGDAFLDRLGPARSPDAPLRPGDADVARGVQDAVEDVFFAAARLALEQTGAGQLAVAGGIFLNCALNGHLHRALDARILPFPVAGDAGAAWGAAAWVHRRLTGRAAAPLSTLRLGTDLALPATGPEGSVADDELARTVASRIAAGAIVGVARGRAEFGPRALGARSILASPCSTEMRDRLNRHKGRESWRPLAPVVRAGGTAFFREATDSPWMILTFPATARGREALPGAVHADGTARVQTVDRERAPFLHAVLDALEARGHPAAVLNTSLNRPGEPIVDTAEEAMKAARAMRLDALVVGDTLHDLGSSAGAGAASP